MASGGRRRRQGNPARLARLDLERGMRRAGVQPEQVYAEVDRSMALLQAAGVATFELTGRAAPDGSPEFTWQFHDDPHLSDDEVEARVQAAIADGRIVLAPDGDLVPAEAT